MSLSAAFCLMVCLGICLKTFSKMLWLSPSLYTAPRRMCRTIGSSRHLGALTGVCMMMSRTKTTQCSIASYVSYPVGLRCLQAPCQQRKILTKRTGQIYLNREHLFFYCKRAFFWFVCLFPQMLSALHAMYWALLFTDAIRSFSFCISSSLAFKA